MYTLSIYNPSPADGQSTYTQVEIGVIMAQRLSVCFLLSVQLSNLRLGYHLIFYPCLT